MSLPDWKKVIDTEFNKYKSGKQSKSGYYINVISYFTGGGTANYPVKGQKVNPTDLSTAELIKYELPDFDIRKIAMAQAIQSNMVESSRVPRDFAGVKGLIDNLKKDAKFARSPPFDNYTEEEKAVWNNCQVPIIGTGTVSSPNNDPLYNKLCDLFNNAGTQAFLTANKIIAGGSTRAPSREQQRMREDPPPPPELAAAASSAALAAAASSAALAAASAAATAAPANMEKYYGNWVINGIGPADAFISGEWDKAFKGMTATQLKGFRLPTDDGRRLKILMNIEQYKNAAAKKPSVDKGPYVANVKALFTNNSNVMSPPLTSAEQTAFSSLTVPGVMAGGRRRRRGSRRSRGSSRKNKRTRRR